MLQRAAHRAGLVLLERRRQHTGLRLQKGHIQSVIFLLFLRISLHMLAILCTLSLQLRQLFVIPRQHCLHVLQVALPRCQPLLLALLLRRRQLRSLSLLPCAFQSRKLPLTRLLGLRLAVRLLLQPLLLRLQATHSALQLCQLAEAFQLSIQRSLLLVQPALRRRILRLLRFIQLYNSVHQL